jgi:hypothetical protein
MAGILPPPLNPLPPGEVEFMVIDFCKIFLGRRTATSPKIPYSFPPASKAFFRARAFSTTDMGVGPRMRIMGSLPQSPRS